MLLLKDEFWPGPLQLCYSFLGNKKEWLGVNIRKYVHSPTLKLKTMKFSSVYNLETEGKCSSVLPLSSLINMLQFLLVCTKCKNNNSPGGYVLDGFLAWSNDFLESRLVAW